MAGLFTYKAASAPPAEGFTPESGFALSGTLADGQTLTLTKAAGGFGTRGDYGGVIFQQATSAAANLDPEWLLETPMRQTVAIHCLRLSRARIST